MFEEENNHDSTSRDADLEIDDDLDGRRKNRFKNYIPKKFNNSANVSKLFHVASAIVIIILLIIIIVNMTNSRKESSSKYEITNIPKDSLNFQNSNMFKEVTYPKSSTILIERNITASTQHPEIINNHTDSSASKDNKAEGNFRYNSKYKLILSDDKKLWYHDVLSTNLSVLHEFDGKIGTFEVHNNGEKIFWSDTDTFKIIYSSLEGDSVTKNLNDKVLLEEMRVKPQKMAYDWIGGNLYIVDKSSGCLIVINLQTKKHDILLSNLIHPYDIDLDSERGLMFILQLSNSIIRGNMDGNSIKRIIVNAGISAMTLDRTTKNIYWVDNRIGIQVADYNGENIKSLTNNALNIIDLAIIDNQLYWLWLPDNELKHHIVSCRITNGTCKGHEMQKINHVADFKSIRVINYANSNKIINPCEIKNGGCQHLCLIVPNQERSCTCNLGWQLYPDEKTCREVKTFILYNTVGGYFKSRVIDNLKNVSTSVVWPTPYNINGDIFFDYDISKDDLYFGKIGESNIFTMKLKKKWSCPSILVTSNRVEDLTYDVRTECLYYLDSRDENRWNNVYKFNLLKKTEESIFEFPYFFEINSYTSLAVDTRSDWFIITSPFIDYNNQKSFSGQGSSGHRFSFADSLPSDSKTKFRSVALDHDNERIYWIAENTKTSVIVANAKPDGTDVKVKKGNLTNIKTININGKSMYLSTDKSIWRLSKDTEDFSDKMVEENDGIVDVRIIGD